MAERSFTVEDVLRMIQIVKRDVEYLKGLENKWGEQKERFPVIYDGIVKQQEALRLKANKLRTLKVTVAAEEVEDLATQLLESKEEKRTASVKAEVKKVAEKSTEKEKKEFEAAEVKPTTNVPDIGRGGRPAEAVKHTTKEERVKPRRRRLGIRANK